MFAKMPKSDEKIAISIYNKHAEELLKDLQTPEEHVAIAPGLHPALTSWLIIPPPPPRKFPASQQLRTR